MILLNLLSWRARATSTPVAPDRSVAFVLVLLMALVFAPVMGLHVALAALGPDTASSSAPSPSNNMVTVAPPSERARDLLPGGIHP